VTVAVWLGNALPTRSVRWLDGVLATAAKLGGATAIAAGDISWLDLAADRARFHGVASSGISSDLSLDYLGWAQVAAAAVRALGATCVLVDEVSRPERFAEVAAIAELLDFAQLTHVVALEREGSVIHASRAAGRVIQTVRVHGSVVLGVRIADEPVDEYPTPVPSRSMRRLRIAELGLDPMVLAHRALPRRASTQPKKTVDRIAEYLAVHVVKP
jgi:hypothetical protein